MTKKIAFKLILSVLCFLNISMSVFAQDTIFYKKTGSIVVFVKEVSQKEVQYKKLEMPDGPMYIIDKSDIAKIVYKNGFTEEIKESVSETAVVATPSQSFNVVYAPAEINTEKITYEDTKRKRSSIVGLIDRHPSPERKPALMQSLSSIRNIKAGQDATRTVGIVFGGITIAAGAITGLIYTIDTYAAGSFAVFPIAFGSVALLSTVAAITLNVNLKKKRRAFVDLYNQ